MKIASIAPPSRGAWAIALALAVGPLGCGSAGALRSSRPDASLVDAGAGVVDSDADAAGPSGDADDLDGPSDAVAQTDASTSPVPASTPFPASDATYGCYRIPATVTLPSGHVLAFAEGRPAGCPDFGNIQIVLRISADQGQTWGPMSVVAQNGMLQADNPSPVVDTLDPSYPNGRVFLFYNTGTNTEANTRNGNGLREQWYVTSVDEGQSWSAPTNITAQTAKMGAAPYHDPADWRALAMGPGHGIELPDGRIIVAGSYSAGPPQPHSDDYTSYAFYTTDHGASFHVGGNTGYPGSNESQVARLSKGAVMMNSRNQTGLTRRRLASVSSDEGVTFGSGALVSALIDPICEGSLLAIAWNGKPYLLFSNPNSSSLRVNGHIRSSKDDGVTWPGSNDLLITAGEFAYSDLTQLDADHVGIIYENGGNGIRFMKLPISMIIQSP